MNVSLCAHEVPLFGLKDGFWMWASFQRNQIKAESEGLNFNLNPQAFQQGRGAGD